MIVGTRSALPAIIPAANCRATFTATTARSCRRRRAISGSPAHAGLPARVDGAFRPREKIATPAKTSAIIFRISGEWLGMPTQAFREIAERRAMHSLPHRRRGVVPAS